MSLRLQRARHAAVAGNHPHVDHDFVYLSCDVRKWT